jgi:hypothetical protein
VGIPADRIIHEGIVGTLTQAQVQAALTMVANEYERAKAGQ